MHSQGNRGNDANTKRSNDFDYSLREEVGRARYNGGEGGSNGEGGGGRRANTMYVADRLNTAREAYIYLQARSLSALLNAESQQQQQMPTQQDAAVALEKKREAAIFEAYQELYYAALL